MPGGVLPGPAEECAPFLPAARAGSSAARKAAIREANTRHAAWTKRHSGAPRGTWRGPKEHRKSAKKIIEAIDNQLRCGSAFGGLSYFRPNDTEQWKPENWRRWPGALQVADQGADGVSATCALQHKK